ncbi:ABC transporter ATP-binding protein [Listeria ivanovii]|uniref:Putative ABC transporter, ATP-binding protein n=1 Tax=Listeria ivanovii (strain ATCC BAA-678 / PAM 55) TaxID=881621 RepID=G2Z8X7_LISIP|nr:ABC transporter ATP-binding protein [Listeria ivanovii]AHI54721.1 multidrug ABC transporter ATP-binding protein [Listeria ivanovii WSLC3009]AIS66660.1 multidrug ABC transporter ATP-binding protein [Listeria ivanovii subsp. ivanovii]MBK3915652.1 ABC transporter ATP-binding protein [Listeria ivanovii subsp. ivanovii]MBK3922798.1 ABC transporter ATP-binding protein [Listeria ivanovii subsp. ivanovii]MBK3927958.1 ABC transporter ATP-binding protein [Listeria ivanovii subsp. ivanovii]
MKSMKWIWQYVRKYRLLMVGVFILIFIASGISIIYPLLGGKVIDDVVYKNQPKLLIPLLLIMIISTIIRTICRYTYQIMCERIGQNSLFQIREDLYKKLQSLDFDFFNNTRVGDIMARMTGDTDAIRHFVSWVSYNILENIFLFTFAIVIMTTIDWKLTLALVILTPLIAFLTMKMSSKAQPVFYEIRESFSRLNSMVEENISGNRVVKAFAREDFEMKKFHEHNEDFKQRNLDSAAVSRTYLPVLDSLAGILVVITLVFGGYLVIKGQMTLGDLVAFNGFLWMLNGPMRMSGWLINDVQRFVASSFKIQDMMATTAKIPIHAEKPAPSLQGYVEFKNVSFHFEDDPTTDVLKNISLKAAPGQTIAILGETGAGKSTLVNLICRFYDPTSGEILLDGVDAKKWHVRELRNHIATVMQDIFLFSDTIEGNIAFGAPDATMEDVRRMARIADADHFIETMPESYDTIVGERGVGLSGGQKQRISLARALLKNPSILILDDTTSAVDMETEVKIQGELKQITENTTTFIIAHRISSVKEADEILILNHGEIIERGTHADLLAKKGYYFDIYNKQLGTEASANG